MAYRYGQARPPPRRAIEIAKRGHLINHRIDPEVDAERDFVGSDLAHTASVSRREYLYGVDPVFHAQTASGEAYHSDSRILLLDLQPVTSVKLAEASQSAKVVRATSLPPAVPGTGQNQVNAPRGVCS